MLAKDKEAKGAPTAAPPPALASEGGSVYAARARSTTRDVAAYIVSVITPLLFSSAPGHVISRWRSGKRRSTEPRRRLEAPPEKHRHNDFGRCRCEQRQTGGAASCSSASMADWCCPRAAPRERIRPSLQATARAFRHLGGHVARDAQRRLRGPRASRLAQARALLVADNVR